MPIRTTSLALAAACLTFPVLAEGITAATPSIPGGPVSVNISYAVNENLVTTEPTALAARDTAHREAMLKRANAECATLLATIATDCVVSAINISTQVNSYPGQPPTLYVNSNVGLQVTLKAD
jgi:hypothetical protein